MRFIKASLLALGFIGAFLVVSFRHIAELEESHQPFPWLGIVVLGERRVAMINLQH